MSIFDIDLNKLSAQLMPQRLRQTRASALVQAMVSPLVYLFGLFGAERAKTLYELTHNGQACRLEAVLNDRFDNILRRVYIIDAPTVLPIYLYRRAEVKPVYVKRRSEVVPKYARRRSELTHGGAFIVNVPLVLVFDLAEMKALVDKYKLAGKAYTIITF